jgi:hypothetical protein
MTYPEAVRQATEIAKRVSQPAFIHVLPGTFDYNFRFTKPIESVPGVTAFTVARIDIDGTIMTTGLTDKSRAFQRSLEDKSQELYGNPFSVLPESHQSRVRNEVGREYSIKEPEAQ